MSNKRDTIEKIRSSVIAVDYTEQVDTKEPCVIFTYTNYERLTIHVSLDELTALKNLSDYIKDNPYNPLTKDVIDEKTRAFDSILNSVINKELILAKYDQDYMK
jgi:hypothetical protein